MEGGVIRGQPVCENYQPPFAYAGTIKKVQIHIAPAALTTAANYRSFAPTPFGSTIPRDPAGVSAVVEVMTSDVET